MRGGILVPALKKKKKALWTWSFLGLLKAFSSHLLLSSHSLNAYSSLHSSSGCTSHPLLQSWRNLSEAEMIPSRPLNAAPNGWSRKRNCAGLLREQQLTGTVQGPRAHALAVSSPSYRRGCGTRRSRIIRLGYRARRDSRLVYLQFSISWPATTSSVSRDLGTWT